MFKKKTDSENALTTTFTVAFLSGNFAMRIDRLEVHVAAAPTPFETSFLDSPRYYSKKMLNGMKSQFLDGSHNDFCIGYYTSMFSIKI